MPIRTLLLVLCAALLLACSASPTATPSPTVAVTPGPLATPVPTAAVTPAPLATVLPGGSVVRSDKPRLTSVAAPVSDLNTLTAGNADFAFALYGQLRAKAAGNFMFSPHSISTALAMTYAGARRATASEMATALRFSLPQERLHPAFNTLDQELSARGKGAQGKDGKGFRLNSLNAIWGQTGYKFLPEFLDLLAQNYGAGMRLLDFVRQSEPSRLAINQWVSDQTESRIKDLIPSGVLKPSTVLVLTNAIYFNAAWQRPFDAKATGAEPFNLPDGKAVTVPMMKQRAEFAYAQADNWQALELPYDGRELSMVILLPAAGAFDPFETSLTGARVDSMLRGLKTDALLDVTLPKWKYESDFPLVEPLQALGMKQAFERGQADFSGMDGTRDLFIAAVLHKAFVAVDEAGTEAAAATAVIVDRLSAPPRTVTFRADRPFVYLIRDIKTGAILFVGRVTNPAG